MADYHAVLLRTLDGLGQTTPQLRAKLYERARITIGKQLESTNPPMSAEAIATQKAHLEAAIASIESEYLGDDSVSAQAPAAPSFVPNPAPAAASPTPPPPPAVEPMPASYSVPPAPAGRSVPPSSVPPAQGVSGAQAPRNLPAAAVETAAPTMPAFRNEAPATEATPEFVNDPVGVPAAEEDYYEPSATAASGMRSGRLTTIIMAVVGLIIIGGGAAALWANRGSLSDSLGQMAGGGSTTQVAGSNSSDVSPVKKGNGLSSSTTVEASNVEKYDQRLNADGKEVAPAPIPESNDNLPAGVAPSPVTTTRIVVPDNNGSTAGQPVVGNGAQVAGNTTDNNTNSGPIVAQKGFLYEEGSARGQNTVDVGTVVWSIVQEAPGEGLPLEPAIRAKVEIGSRGLVLLVTIKRNADAALPASHLIELVFSVPDDFIGGTIDKVQRFVFKESEEERGEALVGVPATIADGIFLIALNNLPQAVERNTQLMKGRAWIDIPLGYRTGRRALITLEKGVPGDRVFKKVFAAWSAAG